MKKIKNLLKPGINFIIWMAGIVTLLLIFLQGVLMNLSITIQKTEFDELIPDLMLEVHHSIEEDPKLSQRIIDILKLREKSKTVDPNLEQAAIEELHAKIDSISRTFGLDLKFDFVIYEKKTQQIMIKSDEYIHSTENFLNQSERAGWRVRKAFGGNKYHIGLDYRNEYLYYLSEQRMIVILSFLITSLLILTLYFTLKGWQDQKKLTELKNNFINNLTHELKTPIFSTSLLHSMIKKEQNGHSMPKIAKYLKLLESENQKIKDRVEKVVDIALLENNQLSLNLQKTDMHLLIKEATELLSLTIKDQGGSISYNFESVYPVCNIDPVHFNGVIYNLVDNAIKYSLIHPEISISTKNDATHFHICISDSGIGISHADQQDIFEKFYRIGTGNLHPVKGMGLGLSYVKSMVQAHSGTIIVSSQPGKGSTFTISLPYDQSSDE